MRTYVMQVLTGKERYTLDLLERVLGSSVHATFFAPRYQYQRKIKGSWELVEELLTPGYVYIKTSMLDIDELTRQLQQVPAFARVLTQDGKIISLSADDEAWLTRLTGANYVVEPSIGVMEGDKIVIVDGPLKGLETHIKKIDRHKRLAYVEVQLLGRIKLVKVGAEIVRKA